MERELMEKRLLGIFKQRYNQGDSYYCRVNNKGDKFIVGYKNDYPMQHGDGVEWMIPVEVVEMLVSQVEPEVILPSREEIKEHVIKSFGTDGSLRFSQMPDDDQERLRMNAEYFRYGADWAVSKARSK